MKISIQLQPAQCGLMMAAAAAAAAAAQFHAAYMGSVSLHSVRLFWHCHFNFTASPRLPRVI
jgi:hypothetical protein